MNTDPNRQGVPPMIMLGGVLVLIVMSILGVAWLEASAVSEPGAVVRTSDSSAGASSTGAFAEDSGSVRTQLAQSAEHQNLGLQAMAPLYSPAVAQVRLFADQAAEPMAEVAGFFVGPGRLAVPLSSVRGAVRGEVLLDVGQSFEVQRIVAEAPEVDLALISIELPSELLRGLQVAFLEPLPGEQLLMIGAARAPGEEDSRHPTATAEVQRVRVGEDAVSILLEGALPEWSVGSPLLNDTGKLSGFVARDAEGRPNVYGAERLLRLDPLPGLSLSEWTGGKSVESTRPPPETEDLWAEIRALPRPDGFGPAPEEFAGFDVRPAKIERVEEGLRIDERFTVTGSGTEGDPYILPWSMMMSASETFNPSRGKLVLPERVTMFDGSWVRFEGNFAIPFAERFVRELLLMQHPWDGCCLGVPPTPYDAVEVALASPIESRPQFGLVTGRLKVDPFVRGQWLYGMYLMEGARLARGSGASEDN